MNTETGHLSDIADLKPRKDWSHLRSDLEALQPGQRLTIKLPADISMKDLRATVLTISRRIDFGNWVIATRSDNDVLHCFLAPK